jgi:hypothetical protein
MIQPTFPSHFADILFTRTTNFKTHICLNLQHEFQRRPFFSFFQKRPGTKYRAFERRKALENATEKHGQSLETDDDIVYADTSEIEKRNIFKIIWQRIRWTPRIEKISKMQEERMVQNEKMQERKWEKEINYAKERFPNIENPEESVYMSQIPLKGPSFFRAASERYKDVSITPSHLFVEIIIRILTKNNILTLVRWVIDISVYTKNNKNIY